MFKLPRFRKETIPLERLTFDSRLQLAEFFNEDGDRVLYDEERVKQYLENLQNGAAFPPLRVMEEKQGKKVVDWVFGGFHRGEMWRRYGANSVECEVYDGTFLDAEFWACSENAHPGRSRSSEECQKAFSRIFDTRKLLDRVLDSCKEKGSIIRSLASATGLSAGAIGKYLEGRGKRVDRDERRIVDIPKPAVSESEPPKPIPAISPARATSPPDSDEDEHDDYPVIIPEPRPPTPSVGGDPEISAAKDVLGRIQSSLRAIGRDVDSLLKSRVGDHLRECARDKGFAFKIKDEERRASIDDVATVPVEYWPTLADLQAVFADTAALILMASVE